MKKIYIFGTFPSPIGGTSIHVYRLFKYMKKYFSVTGVDTYGKANKYAENIESVGNYKKFILKFMMNTNFDLLHSHTHSWNERLILSIICKFKFKKVIFTFHSLRERPESCNYLSFYKIKLIDMLTDAFICPNDDIKILLLNMGLTESKVHTIPTLLLPEKVSLSDIDSRVDEFIGDKDILITANASNNNLYKGVDLYGLDLFIELCDKFKHVDGLKFLYCLTKVTDEANYQKNLNKITSLGLGDRLKIIQDEVDFSSILLRADVFIRPTCYDSYGISVGEAVHLKVPTLASDVCKRTEGAVTFQSRDSNDLSVKFRNIIENLDEYKARLEQIKLTDNAEDIRLLYNKLLNS